MNTIMDTENLRLREKTETVTTDIVEIDEKSKSEDAASLTQSEKWQPGFWNQFPWLGAGCLLAAILISVAAILVLVFSNKKAEVSQWPKRLAPNVVLSVLNSAASVCIAIAVAQGVAISWWRKALRGATIHDLHNTWSFGSSLSSIFLNLKYFNLAALAALVTKLTIIDGVLFQRATSTYIALGPQSHMNISTFPATALPTTGRLNVFANDTDILAYPFTWDIATWQASAYGKIYSTYGFTECEGVCSLRVSQPGYVASCSEAEEEFVDIVAYAEQNAAPNTTQVSRDWTVSGVDFSLNFATKEKNYTWIGLNATSYYSQSLDTTNSTQRCPATVWKQQCELREAMISFPVYLEHTAVATKDKRKPTSSVNVYLGSMNDTTGTYSSLDDFDFTLGQFPGFDFEHYINLTGKPTSDGYSTNAGIYRALSDQFTTRSTVTTRSNDSYWSTSSDGQFASILVDDEDYSITNNNTCPWTFDDPMYSIMLGLNALTFITADDILNRAAWINGDPNEDEDTYTNRSRVYVKAVQYKGEVHYQTNFWFMGGAMASTLVCVMLILPVYWGFWELGRKVSLNPIEIANAFQAPVLAAVHPGSGHADDVVRVAGSQHVQYTHVVDPETGRRCKIVPL